MITDWENLALTVTGEYYAGGDCYAKRALEEILGDEWIEHTVWKAIAFGPGSELAMNCLRYLNSEKAVLLAFEIYKSSGKNADLAVWLIKHLAHPIALNWVEIFLNDPNVIGCGLGVLDQLLWTKRVRPNEKTEVLLQLAEKNSGGGLSEGVQFIRDYLADRNERSI